MKTWGIIGALFFVAAVTVGYFCNFDGAIIIDIGAAAFGLCSLIIGAIKSGKTKNVKTWKTVLIICFAVIGGVLCCIGGLSQNMFEELAGAALASLAVIFGVIFAKTKKQKKNNKPCGR